MQHGVFLGLTLLKGLRPYLSIMPSYKLSVDISVRWEIALQYE